MQEDHGPTPAIRFRLDARSAVPVYRQLVDQVRQALQLGLLQPGDRLPTVREVVGQVPINPNTVHRAYVELDRQGLTEGRPGKGTFVRAGLPAVSPEDHDELRRRINAWVGDAEAAGLDEDGMAALLGEAVRSRQPPAAAGGPPGRRGQRGRPARNGIGREGEGSWRLRSKPTG